MTFVLNFRLIGNIHEQALKKQIARVEKDLTKYLVCPMECWWISSCNSFFPEEEATEVKVKEETTAEMTKQFVVH